VFDTRRLAPLPRGVARTVGVHRGRRRIGRDRRGVAADPGAVERSGTWLPWWAFPAVLMLVVPLLAPLYWGEEFGWTSYLPTGYAH
jgi:hypothetical protein